MPGTVGPLVDQVLRRSRDEKALGTSREQLRLLMTHAQRFVTLRNNCLTEQLTYTLTRRRVVYDINEISPRIGRIIAISCQGDDLVQTPWRSLVRQSRVWLRETAATPNTWAQLGRNLAVIYPGSTQAVEVIITFVPITGVLDIDDQDIAVAEEYHNELMDITEGINMIRRRQFSQALICFARTGLNLDG